MTIHGSSPGRGGGRRHARRTILRAGAALTAAGVLRPYPALGATPLADLPLDFDVADGHHYRQAAGVEGAGYEVRNAGPVRWWDAYRRLGGPAMLGYPVARPYRGDGFHYQALQLGLLQSSDGESPVQPANVLEMLDRAGLAEWLLHFKGVPLPIEDDGGRSFDESVRIRLDWLTDDPIRDKFERNPDPIRQLTWRPWDAQVRWGLPMSLPARLGPFVAQRFQRAVLQHWVEPVEDMPSPGAVTAALLGAFLLEAGLVPASARPPIDSAQAAATAGRTVGDRLQAVIGALLTTEPGRWAVFLALLGCDDPLVALNADAVMPAASLWKAAVMIEAFRQRAVDGLSFDELLTMDGSVLDRIDPPASLAPGQRIPIHYALERMMAFSDNTVAILLADRLGYRRIDQTLRELGLLHTTVDARETLTTAREMAALISVAVGARPAPWHRSLADALSMRELLLNETRNNRIPARLPSGVPVAHKAGQSGGVLNDAGVVYASTGPFTLVLLVDGTPVPQRSAATSADIARIVFDALDPPAWTGDLPAS